jgi:hypothetical protein
MFYCVLHNWYSSEEPCPACFKPITVTTTTFASGTPDESSHEQKKEQERGWEVTEFFSEHNEGVHFGYICYNGIWQNQKDWQAFFLKLDYKIHSVKRLSDGEVFSVGDEVKVTVNRPCKIEGFEIVGGGSVMYVRGKFWYDKVMCTELENLEKVPSPQKSKPIEKEKLFTTEDGVDVFSEYEHIYAVNNAWLVLDVLAKKCVQWEMDYRDDFKYFHAKEKAEEYIAMNRPQYNLKDLEDAFNAARLVCGVPLAHVRDYQLTRENVSADQLNLRYKTFQDYKSKLK